MKFKLFMAAAGAALAIASLPHVALAGGPPTVVATISGAYDDPTYDTPNLVIHNTSGGVFHNATLDLLGYQGVNNGLTAHVSLGDLAAGDTTLSWGYLPGTPTGQIVAGSLTSYDYDDEYGGTPQGGQNNPVCSLGSYYCAQVGNFKVAFNATVVGGAFNGQHVGSSFSPTTNYTSGFVGWEGLDPNGWSESNYDVHSGSITGTLAVITLGTATLGVPEPSTWAMMVLGVGALGAAFRRRRVAAAAA